MDGRPSLARLAKGGEEETEGCEGRNSRRNLPSTTHLAGFSETAGPSPLHRHARDATVGEAPPRDDTESNDTFQMTCRGIERQIGRHCFHF